MLWQDEVLLDVHQVFHRRAPDLPELRRQLVQRQPEELANGVPLPCGDLSTVSSAIPVAVHDLQGLRLGLRLGLPELLLQLLPALRLRDVPVHVGKELGRGVWVFAVVGELLLRWRRTRGGCGGTALGSPSRREDAKVEAILAVLLVLLVAARERELAGLRLKLLTLPSPLLQDPLLPCPLLLPFFLLVPLLEVCPLGCEVGAGNKAHRLVPKGLLEGLRRARPELLEGVLRAALLRPALGLLELPPLLLALLILPQDPLLVVPRPDVALQAHRE
mmetsp:Transcript_6292/g.21576  ORF Transcript_6292/g.21576 Transcript_6292/m.21576 type:complete len:275 (-) Transcript_6292:344-1168(-)